jgi:hypothetical protein
VPYASYISASSPEENTMRETVFAGAMLELSFDEGS